MRLRFDFGRNWEAFSTARMSPERLDEAAASLRKLIGAEEIRGRTFVDVGCGSGLFSLAAVRCGASRVLGFDISPTAIDVSRSNAARLAGHLRRSSLPDFHIADVLDSAGLAQFGAFDIVYAWGSLHHTGSLWRAVRNTAALVKPDAGLMVLAIYNHHWTSPIWKQIKRLYNLCLPTLREMLNYLFAAPIYVGVWVTARRNPIRKERGMDFWYDVVDWLGGYPYEYASNAQVVTYVERMGFQIQRMLRPRVGTGCNEFVFRRSDRS